MRVVFILQTALSVLIRNFEFKLLHGTETLVTRTKDILLRPTAANENEKRPCMPLRVTRLDGTS